MDLSRTSHLSISLTRVFVIVFSISIPGCNVDFARIWCDEKVDEHVQSPDGEYIATAFEQNCGATAPYVTVVSIRDASEAFDAENASLVFSAKGQRGIRLEWRDNRLLMIGVVGLEWITVYSKTYSWRDVVIQYEGDSLRET
jgi:hypothetical protein